MSCEYSRSDITLATGYKSLAENISAFFELGYLLLEIDVSTLDEGGGIEATLMRHAAKWHNGCRNKFSNLKLERAFKRKNEDDSTLNPAPANKRTRRSYGVTLSETKYDKSCIFCDEETEPLHQVSSFNIDTKIRECAVHLEDTRLLAKLSAGDQISKETMYHAKCLAFFYKRAKRSANERKSDMEKVLHGNALAQLVAYVEDARSSELETPVLLRLAELTDLYTKRLEQLSVSVTGRLHSTDLKRRLLSQIPGLQARRQGRDVLFVFDKDVGLALKQIWEREYDDKAMTLFRAAKIVRRDVLNKRVRFDGTFHSTCQQDSVPESLKTLVAMMTRGQDIRNQSNGAIDEQSTLSLAQLVVLNSSKRKRKDANNNYHSSDREIPVPAYIGLMLHAETRKHDIIDRLYSLGMSISYDRVLAISTEMDNKVSAQFKEEHVVCPISLRKGLFTTAAVDNTDHNPSSTTAQGSFHGTGISLFQHQSASFSGEERSMPNIGCEKPATKCLAPLPEFYPNVRPVVFPKRDPSIPACCNQNSSSVKMKDAVLKEYKWLEQVKDSLDEDMSEKQNNIMWSAFHASKIPSTDLQLSTSALLPLFEEKAASAAMSCHAIAVVKQAVDHLNPGQVPVVTCDQPLFAIAKNIQWIWQNMFREDKLFVILGGLHTELAALKAIGHWLEDSGWDTVLAQSGDTTQGTPKYFLTAVHISRTRHAHQLTASALYALMSCAYEKYVATAPEGGVLAFCEWRKKRTNYARWLAIHVCDLANVDLLIPSVALELSKGNFAVKKSQRRFSAIPIDQAHERNGKIAKDDGGAIGLTEDKMKLLRWMVSGPELSSVILDFEASQELVKEKESNQSPSLHHEETKAAQTSFQNPVNALLVTMKEMGNPFEETSQDLYRISSSEK